MNQAVNGTSLLIADDRSGQPPWESRPASEAAAVEAIAEAIEARVRTQAAQSPPARRDAHPKMHGCVQAEFRVLDDLPAPLRVGLFEQARAYPAWIRFSNGNGSPQPDAVGDGRGMAVKVMGVAASRSGTQDFIMINNPAFFVRNAADYVAFNADPNPQRFFFPSWNPFAWRFHELFVAIGITRRQVSNPLNVQYWSMTPYLLGEAAMKFSARPVGTPAPFEDRSTPDFLHDNLVKALGQADAAFDFCVQLCARPDRMPIEDPTIEWREADAPFVPVARITIPRQVFDTPQRAAFGENLSFTPWHGLDAHRPLGGINRVRRVVYEAISRLRHDLNGAPRAEPTAATTTTPS